MRSSRAVLSALTLALCLPLLASSASAAPPKRSAKKSAVILPTGAPGEPAAIALGTKTQCPVTGETFVVDAETVQVIYAGKRYAFCCPDCLTGFKKSPARFVKA